MGSPYALLAARATATATADSKCLRALALVNGASSGTELLQQTSGCLTTSQASSYKVFAFEASAVEDLQAGALKCTIIQKFAKDMRMP